MKLDLIVGTAILFLSAGQATLAAGLYDCHTAEKAAKTGDQGLVIENYTLCLETGQVAPEIRARAFNNRGNAHLALGDYDLAISDYNDALRLDPDDPDTYYNRGSAYLDRGEYDLAIADFDETLRLDPLSAYAFNNRGIAQFNREEFDQAIADWD